MEIDCYKFLGISPDADEKTIHKAWRLKTKEVHPDVNRSRDAAHRFNRLTEAMNTLLDPPSRLRHDRLFGYYDKPKNQETNNKQKFTEYQETKAKATVEEWSIDYNVAMEMRERQRQQTIAKHRKKIRKNILITLFGVFVVFLLIFLFLHTYSLD